MFITVLCSICNWVYAEKSSVGETQGFWKTKLHNKPKFDNIQKQTKETCK
jgi:hypothetical protein